MHRIPCSLDVVSTDHRATSPVLPLLLLRRLYLKPSSPIIRHIHILRDENGCTLTVIRRTTTNRVLPNCVILSLSTTLRYKTGYRFATISNSDSDRVQSTRNDMAWTKWMHIPFVEMKHRNQWE